MSDIRLCPSQQNAVDKLVADSESSQLLHLWSFPGFGRSTMLNELQKRLGGTRISMSDLATAVESRHPLALEESLNATIIDAFSRSSHVFVDDWHLLASIVSRCDSSYPRAGYLEVVSAAIVSLLEQDRGRRLIIGADTNLSEFLRPRSQSAGVHEFTPDDYRHLCTEFGKPTTAVLDIEQIHRFAPGLSAYQLAAVCQSCRLADVWTTDSFLDHLRDEHLVSNVSLPEVAPVQFEDLIGMDDLVEKLISNIVFPLENDALAQQYSLRPKRGVLLLGPPGTGKTTIGKALAHRLRGKFFVIDGTVISGTQHFYYMIQHIIEQAKNNAPSVVFIDDSDVIFENQQEHGLYRYLLTVLDGLESQSLQRICIMMTAMELRHIPPALIRSGRVELWLETRLPDEAARIQLLRKLTNDLPESIRSFDVTKVGQAAERCTPADLKRLVNDAKTAYAWAEYRNSVQKTFTEFLLDAIKDLHEMKALYAKVRESTDNRSDRPVWFDVRDASDSE